MTALQALFWNTEQARLRVVFRIVLQLTVFFILMKGLAALLRVPGEIAAGAPARVYLAVAGVRLLRVLISVWLAARLLDHRRLADFGLQLDKGWWQDLAFGLVLGALMMGAVFGIQLAAGWATISDTLHTVDGGSFWLYAGVFVVLFVCVGFSEELLYRGYHMTNLAEGLNHTLIGKKWAVILAVILSSALFGLFHLGSPHSNWVSTIIIGLWGVWGGLAYAWTGRLAIPIGVHTAWNLFQGNVFGFPVSGTTFAAETATVFSIRQAGPTLWTGGVFGPEGGLLGLLVILAGLVIMAGWVKWRQGRIGLDLQLAQYVRPSKNESKVSPSGEARL